MKEELARKYATDYHKGQVRKGNGLPAVTHPEGVVRNLRRFGINDDPTLSTAWLHDTLEDTCLDYDEIYDVFGEEIAEGVYSLTKDTGPDLYKRKIAKSPRNIQLIKLCDVLHNVSTLDELRQKITEYERLIGRKIQDCQEFYIPLAKEICPAIAKEIEKQIS